MSTRGRFNFDETVREFFDIAVWNCPHCGCEVRVEPDADYMVECEECGKSFRVVPVECVV